MQSPAQNASFASEIRVSATQEDCFRAITEGMRLWWTSAAEGDLSRIGSTVTVRFPPQESFWTLRADLLDPPHRVEATCIEAHHILLDQPGADREEWLGTRLTWIIDPAPQGSTIRLIHEGLVPGLACYDICEEGWRHFFCSSLKALLDGGVSRPHG